MPKPESAARVPRPPIFAGDRRYAPHGRSRPRRPRRFPSLLAALTLVSPGVLAAQEGGDGLRITLERNTEAERATASALWRLTAEREIGRWVLTRDVVIDERAIPHSHPVLTLHTRHLGNDDGLLATFLHEQFHWLEEGSPDFRAAMEAFAEAYPDAPAGGPEGARDLESTYRHLVVCDLEYQAMTELVGEEAARRLLSRNRHYTWIYDRVLNDPKVREINVRHGMVATR